MLLRLPYLGVTNAFAMLRLLPMSNRDKDVEILALHLQITVLHRQLGNEKVRFAAQAITREGSFNWAECAACDNSHN